MTKRIVPAFLLSALIITGSLIQADFADADSSSCNVTCYSQERDCKEKVKESPNDIDRVACEEDNRICLANCAEESRREEEQRQREQAAIEQEEKAQLESQGISSEEQQQIKLKRQQEEQEQRDRDADDLAVKEEQDRARKADEAREQEKQKKEQEKQTEDSSNGIKIYQFK